MCAPLLPANACRAPLSLTGHALCLALADVALQRIHDFLTDTPLIDRFEAAFVPGAINDDPTYIGFRNTSFTWGKEDEDDPAARGFTLQIDDLRFKQGKVNIIAGPTGSGKTSLLMALLGEMHFVPTKSGANFSLPRTGGISYASQQSWLQNKTLKDNILFGSPFDEARYKQVVHQCALERDFTLFDAGDETEVGGESSETVGVSPLQ
jgi:ABC-type multidrug transport system fused ATPase/permease subunit